MNKLLTRTVNWLAEKAFGAGIWLAHGSGVSYPQSRSDPHNWWQLNRNGSSMSYTDVGPLYSCIKIISEDMSRIPPEHVVKQEDGSFDPILNRAPARLFHRPNKYQTWADFMLNFYTSEMSDGNAYAYAVFNEREEVTELYPLHPKGCWPYIEPESGEIFYQITKNANVDIIGLEQYDEAWWVPQRYIFHMRLQTPRHPLVGESPIVSVVYPLVTNVEINKHTADFFHNMGRPSGILRHPGDLDAEAMVRIKKRFQELFTSGNTGEPIVLREGMDWTPLTMSAVDSELIQSYRLTERQIAQAFRIPAFMLGELADTKLNTVESLVRYYIQSCLGFHVNHFELGLARFLGLRRDEAIRLDMEEAMIRGDFEGRMNAYSKGVQSAIFTPNEARRRVHNKPVPDGDDARVQQQLVPLSYGANLEPPNNTPASEPAPAEASVEELVTQLRKVS